MWLQIVGKVRLRLTPPINHSWHTTLYVTPRGLTTSLIPHGARSFQIDFDFVDHRLIVAADDGARGGFALKPQTVSDFYRHLMEELARMGLAVRISQRPNEVADAIPFPEDNVHRSYDADAVNRFWRATLQSHRVMGKFRSRFIGKCSPVHLFWGALDLAVTRFSGRTAPEHPGGIPNLPDRITREAYSHEVSSCGFWPGAAPVDDPAFYAYAYPEPAGFSDASVRPDAAFYHPDLHEFVLPVRCGARVPGAGRNAAGVFAVHLRSRRESRTVGSRRARTRRRTAHRRAALIPIPDPRLHHESTSDGG